MFEEMTFTERLSRNLKLESIGIPKPYIEIDELLEAGDRRYKTSNLQDCCFKFIQLRKNNRVTKEVKAKIGKLIGRIKERTEFLTRNLKEDEEQYVNEGTYKENYSDLKAKYYEILSWRSALEALTGKEFKPLKARKYVQIKVDDARRWNNFLEGIGIKYDA